MLAAQECTFFAEEYGHNANVPSFAPDASHPESTWCAISAKDRDQASYDCAATVAEDTQRLCMCSGMTSAEFNALRGDMSARLNQVPEKLEDEPFGPGILP